MIITYVKSNETESWRTIGDGKHCWAGGSHHEIVGNLDGRSVYMNDLRRVGKTMILRKMEAHPPAGWLAVKRDLGGFHSAAEFATLGISRFTAHFEPQNALPPPNESFAGKAGGH